ncbi:MAG: hypothetical protein H7A32_02390 [Deltaproteobacteria bacterium]|nr:hypothetical protein [Deltaproteobacteria bacterium]
MSNRSEEDPIYLSDADNPNEIIELTSPTGSGEIDINCDDASTWHLEAHRSNGITDFVSDAEVSLQEVAVGQGSLKQSTQPSGEPSYSPGPHSLSLSGVEENQKWRVDIYRNRAYQDSITGEGSFWMWASYCPARSMSLISSYSTHKIKSSRAIWILTI